MLRGQSSATSSTATLTETAGQSTTSERGAARAGQEKELAEKVSEPALVPLAQKVDKAPSPRVRSSTFDDIWSSPPGSPATSSSSTSIHRRRSSLHRDWPVSSPSTSTGTSLRIQTNAAEQITTGSSSAVFSPVITSPTPITPTARASFDSFLRLDSAKGSERRRSSLLSAPRIKKARGSDIEDNEDDVETPMASSSHASGDPIKPAGLRQTSYRATSSSAAAFVAAANAAPTFNLSHSSSHPQLASQSASSSTLPGYPFPRNGASSSSLAPLPQDPYNILPLTTAPSTPMGSPPLSRFHTPSGSPRSEYPFTFGESSPRTSSSSTRVHNLATSNWSSTEGENDQSEDDDITPLAAQREFIINQSTWWPSASSTSSSTAPRISSEWARRKRKYRRWLAWVGRKTGVSSLWPGSGYAAVRLSGGRVKSRRRREQRQREEILKDYGGEWVGQVMEWVPTRPWSIALTLMLFASFALGLTFTLIHLLNPDKSPLPWRSYCISPHPTLWTLQDPATTAHSSISEPILQPFTSQPADTLPAFSASPQTDQSPEQYNTFTSSASSLVLQPLTPTHELWPYGAYQTPPLSAETAGDELDQALEPVGVYIGVFTTDAGLQRRMMIRQSYGSHWRSRTEGTEGVRVRFVMGKPRRKYERQVRLEMEAYNDILLLDIPENMNSGKTHAFFSWAAENATVPDYEYPLHPRPPVEVEQGEDGEEDRRAVTPLDRPVWRGEKQPHYVVKADEDSFLMLGEMERRLRVAPRRMAYWGYLVKNLFMAGECYALSFDLVQYINKSPALRSLVRGKEDKLVARWMRMHPEREKIVWVAEKCWIYDHPKAGTVYSHGFLFPSTVDTVRLENQTVLPSHELTLRGGPTWADTYSSVSNFGVTYRPPHDEMSPGEEVEALIEGSEISRLSRPELAAMAAARLASDVNQHNDQRPIDASASSSTPEDVIRDRVSSLYSRKPSRLHRFRNDPKERGGTVVVHFIKKQEWFVETMIALLGPGAGDVGGVFEKDHGPTGVTLGRAAGL